MQLKLNKPLVFFDLETTGLNITNDRIVEISYIKLYPNGNDERKTYRINPEMPIPEVSSAVHGIYDNDVANCPTFKQLAKTIAQVFIGADIAGYNSNKLDVPMLAEEFLRADIDIDLKRSNLVDVQNIFMKMEPRTLSAAYKFYCNNDLANAHSAMVDVDATYEVLKAQLDRYPNLQNEVAALSQFSTHNKTVDFAGHLVADKEGEVLFNFGRYKGQRVKEVLTKDKGYYGWLQNAEFPKYTKKVITNIFLELNKH